MSMLKYVVSGECPFEDYVYCNYSIAMESVVRGLSKQNALHVSAGVKSLHLCYITINNKVK